MDLEELLALGEVPYRPRHIDAHALLTTLQPAADAQADADVGAVGDVHGSLVACEVAENTSWDPAQRINGWIIGVNTYEDPRFLGHGSDPPDHVFVVLPQLVLRVLAAVGQLPLELLAAPPPLGVLDV